MPTYTDTDILGEEFGAWKNVTISTWYAATVNLITALECSVQCFTRNSCRNDQAYQGTCIVLQLR